jgi:hypothetical protein
MAQESELYSVLKEQAYGAAQVTAGCGNSEAHIKGFIDVFDLIMSNSNHSRQPTFLGLLPEIIPSEGDRQVLLDGMAREYAGLNDWAAYVDQQSER